MKSPDVYSTPGNCIIGKKPTKSFVFVYMTRDRNESYRKRPYMWLLHADTYFDALFALAARAACTVSR